MTEIEKVKTAISYELRRFRNPGLGCSIKECPYADDKLNCWERLAHDILTVVERERPIKPTVSVDTWICSQCGHRLESQELIDDKENPQILVHEQFEYCPGCGRKVKWDG